MRSSLTALAIVAFIAAAPARGHTSDALKSVVDSYLQIQSQLAADKIDGIKEPSRAIAAKSATMGAPGKALGKAASALEAAHDLKAAREAFGPLTDAVLEAGKAEGWKDVDQVKLAYCPMVNRSWLQKEEKIRNPYYGSSMLTCGEFKPLAK